VNKLKMWVESLLRSSKLSTVSLGEELLRFIEHAETNGINDGLLRNEKGQIIELLSWWDNETHRPAVLHLLAFHGEEEVKKRLRRNVNAEMFIEFFDYELYWQEQGLPLFLKDPKFTRLILKLSPIFLY